MVRPILHVLMGTVINVVAVLAGGSIGVLVGTRLPVGIRQTTMHAIGTVTLLVGVQSFLEYNNPLVPLVSVVAGLIVGELLGIEGGLRSLGDNLQRRFSKGRAR